MLGLAADAKEVDAKEVDAKEVDAKAAERKVTSDIMQKAAGQSGSPRTGIM